MSAYEALAFSYDGLTQDIAYEETLNFVESVLQRLGKSPKTVLDLACGTGSLSFVHLFTKEELPKTRLCSVLTVEPGASVGQHSHTGEGELYVVLDGPVTLQEDGVDHILHTGDAEYCSDGHYHGVYNHTDKPAVLMAIVML